MSNSLRMNNILIVDNDEGFIAWLGGALLAVNQQPWPACSVSDAIVLVSQPTEPLDLLIINSSLPRSSELITLLRRSHTKLKVIAFGKKGNTKLAAIHKCRHKPLRLNDAAKEEWLEVVKRVLVSKNSVPNLPLTPTAS